jgi:DNA-binding XRE family transcriptional regulator
MEMKVQDQKHGNDGQKVDVPDRFTEQGFYEALAKDLKSARALVLIQSPFIAEWRLRSLEKQLQDCISRNVRVCVFMQEPRLKRGDPDSEIRLKKIEMLVDLLRSWGVHVSVKRSIHAKLIVIDETILWEGSLNPLSHTDSFERMLRWCNRDLVLEAILMHRLNSCDHCSVRHRSLRCLPETISAKQQWEQVGAMVAKRRKDLGLTQSSLAERSGTQQTVLSQIESGKRVMSINMLIKICAQLQLEVRLLPWFYLPSIDEQIIG